MNGPPRQPEVVVGALLTNERGEVFVARFSKIAGHYAIPGGHIEYGETAAQALARELQEETHLTPTRFRLIQVTERICPPRYKDGQHHLVYLDFVVDRWEGTLQLDGQELTEGQWVSPEGALALPLTPTSRRLIEYYLAVGPDGPAHYAPDSPPLERS
ncbi:MAG TPA: NUDIX domain-containing protein [Chloroflexi bacterium]|nr:NUDIX domain-containing protein [Chloroflexota bacterium]